MYANEEGVHGRCERHDEHTISKDQPPENEELPDLSTADVCFTAQEAEAIRRVMTQLDSDDNVSQRSQSFLRYFPRIQASRALHMSIGNHFLSIFCHPS